MVNLNITKDKLFQGCIVSSIAHAVWSRKYSFAKYWHYWELNNCYFNDIEGNLATVSFLDNGVIGVIFRKDLFDEESFENYKRTLNRMINKLPTYLRKIAEKETIQYFIQDFQGQEIPLISDIFWNSDDVLVSSSTKAQWENIWLKLLKKQLLEYDQELLSCQSDYNLDENEMSLISYFSKKKLEEPYNTIKLYLDPEMQTSFYIDDFETTLELLRRMNIYISRKNQ